MAYPNGVLLTKTRKGAFWFKCDSLESAYALTKTPHHENKHLMETLDYRTGGKFWWGVDNLTQAKSIMQAGAWPEAVERFVNELSDFEAEVPRSIKRTRRWADQGDSLDIHRVYSGQLDRAWQRCSRSPRPASQHVVIMCKIGGTAGVDSERMFWRGAAALALADKLTKAGYSVQVEASHTSRNVSGGKDMAVNIPVKDARAPMDMNALAVTVCLAAFFRYAVFAHMCACPDKTTSGFGSTVGYRSVVSEEDDPRVMLIADDHVGSKDSAREWISECIAQLQPQDHAESATY